jgi:hypothetical protein
MALRGLPLGTTPQGSRLSSGLVVPPELRNDPDVIRQLAELNALLEANPLQGYNNPNLTDKVHRKQLEFHAAQTRIKGIIAGNRCGKTIGCKVDDLIQAVDEDCLPEHLKSYKRWEPPFICWLGAPKFEKHRDTIIPILRKFCPKDQLLGGSFDKAFNGQNWHLRFKNGSEFYFKTYDQDVDAWASAEIHRVDWDEEPEGEHGLKLRSEARARLVSTNGDEILGMTPLFGLSWVHDKIWERRDDPGITVVHMAMEDNPWLTPQAIEEFAEELTSEERRARVGGEFVHFAGLVYPELKDEHFAPAPSPDHLKCQDIVAAIDPGIRTTGVIFAAFDRDNSMLVFDELYLHNDDAIPEQSSLHILAKLSDWGIDPAEVKFLIDPSARNRSLTDADRVQAAYWRAGIKCYAAQHDVEAGVFEVKRRLETNLIRFSEDCKTTKWEHRRYRIDPKADGSFAVVKQDDHLCDPTRYIAMSRPIGPNRIKRQPPKRQRWVQGTAPPLDLRPRRPVGPMGAFS